MYTPNEKDPKDTSNGIEPDTVGTDSEKDSSEEESKQNKKRDEINKMLDEISASFNKIADIATKSNEDYVKEKKREKRKKIIFRIIILLISFGIGFSFFFPMFKSAKDAIKFQEISYSEALVLLNEGKDIKEVLMVKNSSIAYMYKSNTDDGKLGYKTKIPSIQAFTEFVYGKEAPFTTVLNYKFTVVDTDPYQEKGYSGAEIARILYYVLLVVLVCSSFISMRKAMKNMKNMNGDSITKMLTGRDKDEIKPVETSSYSFDDVAGIDQERWEVEEVVDMLKYPEKYRATGAKVPKGILLNGKPGTGKTLIAKAIAGEAGVNFYTCAGSSFDNVYVGVGASKVRELFEIARKNAPSIVFIDEIDAVAKKRYTDHSYNEQTLNQLLAELDGFNETDNVIFIAATNHIEALDPAITRPGRFDRIINIPLPDRKGRYEILQVHSKNKVFANDTEKENILQNLARKTSGMSGATLENILNEASIVAIRNKRTFISGEDIDEAFIKIILGISKNDKKVLGKAKELVAYHEAGHAIIGRIKRPERKVLQVSIVPRGNAGGYTLYEDAEETGFPSKEDFYNDILVSLGGRAAEKYRYGTISVGASGDLEKANTVAHEMIYTYAMSNSSQMVRLFGEDDYNSNLEEEMYSEMKDILDKAYEESCEIIEKNHELLAHLAKVLINIKSTLNADEIDAIFTQFGV